MRIVPRVLLAATTAVAVASSSAPALAGGGEGYAVDPRDDVRISSADAEPTTGSWPSVDITGWGVTEATADSDSTTVTLRVDTAARPELDSMRSRLSFTLGPNEGPRSLWSMKVDQADGSPALLKWDGEGGWWEVGCPGMTGGIDDQGFGVTLDTACMKGPERLVLRVHSAYAGEEAYYRDGTEVLFVDLPASGGRLAVPPAVDTDPSCAGAPEGAFSDSGSNVHRRSIDCVAHLGITQGKGDGRYAPHEALTRGQLATFLLRALDAAGIAVPSPEDEHDYHAGDDGHRHESSINALTTMMMFYSEDGRVDLDEIVTRAEMSLFLDKALWSTRSWPSEPAPDYFEDDTHHSPSMVEGRINRVADAGISGGKGDGRYAPDDRLTRDAMATFLTRLHARLADADPTRREYGWWNH